VAMGDPTGEADRGALRLDFDRRLLLQFRSSAITSDAGLLTYRDLDDTLRLTDTGADTLADARTGKNGRHQLAGLLRQSVSGRLADGADGVVVMVLTEKNWQLWPDIPADRALYDALETGDYAKWQPTRPTRSRRATSTVLLAGRNGGARPQAGQGGVSRKLGLCVTGGLSALPRLVAGLPAVRRSTCPRSTT
jgi:hypothetical protein